MTYEKEMKPLYLTSSADQVPEYDDKVKEIKHAVCPEIIPFRLEIKSDIKPGTGLTEQSRWCNLTAF